MALGAPPQPRGGFAARTLLGAPRPDPRWGLPPADPVLNEVWGGAWLGGLRPCGFAALSLGPFGLATRERESPPAKLDSDKFGSSRRDQTGWLD